MPDNGKIYNSTECWQRPKDLHTYRPIAQVWGAHTERSPSCPTGTHCWQAARCSAQTVDHRGNCKAKPKIKIYTIQVTDIRAAFLLVNEHWQEHIGTHTHTHDLCWAARKTAQENGTPCRRTSYTTPPSDDSEKSIAHSASSMVLRADACRYMQRHADV